MLLLLELPAIGASAPIAKFVKIPGLNSRRNSWSAVGKTVLTKLKKVMDLTYQPLAVYVIVTSMVNSNYQNKFYWIPRFRCLISC